MAIYKLPLVLDPQPEGGFTVTCPVLPELVTEGDTAQEALRNANDALEALLHALERLGRPLPASVLVADEAAPIILDTAVAVP